MPTRLTGIVIDAIEPRRLADFWAEALGWRVTTNRVDGVVVEAEQSRPWGDGGTPRLRFASTPGRGEGRNRLHLDLMSRDPKHQRDAVERLLALGARPIDIGQGEVPWDVLTDPEGNELCVLEPRDDYRGARDVAAVVVACAEPGPLVGLWSQITGWPVGDASPELAWLQHPAVAATRLELLAVPGGEQTADRLRVEVTSQRGALAGDVARLEAAGARRVGGAPDRSRVDLADPAGTAFHVAIDRG